MRPQSPFCFAKIRLVIRSEAKPHSLPCPAGHGVEKPRLHQSMLVMPLLRPGIGKEYEDGGQPRLRRQRFEKHVRLRTDKVEVGKLRPVSFPFCAVNSFAHEINPQTQLRRMRSGVGG